MKLDFTHEEDVNFDTSALANVFFNWRYAQDDFDPYPVMNAIVDALDHDTQIVFPIILMDDDYNPIPKSQLEGVDVLDEFDSDHIVIPVLNSVGTDRWVPLFTSEEELLKGEDAFFIYVSLTAAWDMVLADDTCQGLVFNPWSDNIPLDKNMMRETMEHDPVSHISLVLGDITKLHVDAIVNAANKSLLGGGGVDGAIHRAAGKKLLEECKKLRGCETGEAKITYGYRLPCKYVVHTVGPIYKSGQESGELLASCYRNSLDLAYKYGCKTIAFPCISTGAYGYPMNEAVPIALLTISDWLAEHDDDVIDVYCCCYDEADYDTYGQFMDALSENPELKI